MISVDNCLNHQCELYDIGLTCCHMMSAQIETCSVVMLLMVDSPHAYFPDDTGHGGPDVLSLNQSVYI